MWNELGLSGGTAIITVPLLERKRKKMSETKKN